MTGFAGSDVVTRSITDERWPIPEFNPAVKKRNPPIPGGFLFLKSRTGFGYQLSNIFFPHIRYFVSNLSFESTGQITYKF